MTRTWKRIALSSVAAGLLVGGGWVWLKDASAITTPYAQPDVAVSCAGDREHELAVNSGPFIDAATQGAIHALTGKTTLTSDGRQTMALTVTGTSTDGYVEGVGQLTISMDTSRQAPASSLTANQRGAAFPATQVMRFYPKFTLNDEVFTSTTPVQVVSSNVSSFPPAKGTAYVLTNSMTLRSDKGNTISLRPGRAFTITG
jgi:hypothetical protein